MIQKHSYRLYLSIFFFLSGFCFSTWASRIPTIKTLLNFNDAELGTVLLFMPISSMAGLPISGWLVARYDSRVPLVFAFVLLSISLASIGFATSTFLLIASICVFAFSLRILNISMNTQSITLQKQFERKITGSFHGLWSTGGIVGVGFSTLLVAYDVPMKFHLAVVALIAVITTLVFFRFLIRNDRASTGNKFIIGKPDPFIMYLGLLVFFAAICEGGMFDWSGIYFKEVVNVELFTLGYLIFMIFMAISRFASDFIVEWIGMPVTYLISACLIVTGISIAIVWPSFTTSMIGFCLVGWGTAPIIPMTYMLAGTSKKYAPGMTISIIASYGIVGMLIGPPLIGYLAHAFHLRVAFIAFALSGLMLIPISQMSFKKQQE